MNKIFCGWCGKEKTKKDEHDMYYCDNPKCRVNKGKPLPSMTELINNLNPKKVDVKGIIKELERLGKE
jgi:hypothetical protein